MGVVIKMDYMEAGVDIKKAHKLLEKTVHNLGINISDFAGFYDIQNGKMLVSSTDGVGTKIILAEKLKIYDGLAQDLFAMVVNDIITSGAKPLFFLDYIAANKIERDIYRDFLKRLDEICKQNDVLLLGGETAEMPGLYSSNGIFDIVGFAVGIVDKEKIISNSNISVGDILIGISSSGPHSNGFSLIRSALTHSQIKILSSDIMKPTNIYNKVAPALKNEVDVHSFCHITGGGLPENILRTLDDDLAVDLFIDNYDIPDVFKKIMKFGNIPLSEMFAVFNMGIGFVIITKESEKTKIISVSKKYGFEAKEIGKIRKAGKQMRIFVNEDVLEYE